MRSSILLCTQQTKNRKLWARVFDLAQKELLAEGITVSHLANKLATGINLSTALIAFGEKSLDLGLFVCSCSGDRIIGEDVRPLVEPSNSKAFSDSILIIYSSDDMKQFAEGTVAHEYENCRTNVAIIGFDGGFCEIKQTFFTGPVEDALLTLLLHPVRLLLDKATAKSATDNAALMARSILRATPKGFSREAALALCFNAARLRCWGNKTKLLR